MPNVLFVDDEKNILEGYRRNFFNRYDVTLAISGQQAIERINNSEQFNVIVSDYKMPGMNGVELLEEVKKLSPDTVQIMLTGQADMHSVVDLINRGKIFRFLTKPCSPDDMAMNIDDGIKQYELIMSERELLGKTLAGSIKILGDLLALAKPQAFNRTQRIRGIVRAIYEAIDIDNKWQIEIAATLSQIGCVTLPDDILKKVYKGLLLSDSENIMYLNHPSVGADMIANIPRMLPISEIIRYQEKNFDGTGSPSNNTSCEEIPLGSRILKIALDYDRGVSRGEDGDIVIAEMKKRTNIYDSAILSAAEKNILKKTSSMKSYIKREVTGDELTEDMYLAEDLVTASGQLIGNRNQKLTKPMISAIINFVKSKELIDRIKIIIDSSMS